MISEVSHINLPRLSIHETDILKGIVILSVMINHFINNNIDQTLDYQYFLGYANGLIIIFFILSGYGIYYSLNKAVVENSTSKKWQQFYFKRIVRIYPLFVISLLLISIIAGSLVAIPSFFFIQSPYWFIDAIVYCYLLTPLFILILDKLSLKKFIFVFFGSILILASITYFLSDYVSRLGFTVVYKNVLFSYFLAYIGGMALLKYQEEISKNKYLNYLPVYLGFFLFFTWLTRIPLGWSYQGGSYQVVPGTAFQVISGIIFILLSILLIASIIKTGYLKNVKLNLLALIGLCSLTMYLFQPIFYNLVYQFTNDNTVLNIILVLVFFPLFLAICYFSERYLSRISSK